MNIALQAIIEQQSMPVTECGCWIWMGTIRHGYGSRGLDGKTNGRPAHRISWEAYRGPIPDGAWVLHKCDIPLCVNPEHLFLGDHQDNVDDKVAKDRHIRGERSWSAKLTASQVLEIFDSRLSDIELAVKYGIARSTARNIKNGQTWRHITGPRSAL